jgi:signal transduction histidine kinase/ligand-binding sensor domain-containing protein
MSGQENVVFEELTTKDGLSNGTINSIFQDSKGFMWFCTDDGLNRYDGYSFKIYKSELSNSPSANNIQFFTALEDVYGHIWVGTSNGLYFYDQANDRIVQFSIYLDIDLLNDALDESINCLLFDSNNYLWLGSYNGVLKIKIDSKDVSSLLKEDFILYTNFTNDSLEISNNRVYSFHEDQQQQIWISTNSDHLDCFNYEKNSFSQKKIDIPFLDKYLNLSKIIEVDKNDNIWIATRGKGLIFWDRKKQTFQAFESLTNNDNVVDISFIQSLMLDKQDNLWIGTDGNGLIHLDPSSKVFKHYKNDIEDQSNLSSNAIYSIFEDPTGILWIGNYIMGVNKFVPNKMSFGAIYSSPYSKTGLSHNLITGFCEDQNKQIWITTDGGGINIFDREKNRFKHYKHNHDNPASISTNTTITSFCDNNNNIWIGTYNGGLNKLDPKTQIFEHFWNVTNDTTSISSNHTWDIVQDKFNNIWVATVDDGINLLKPQSSSFIRYSKFDSETLGSSSLCSNSITQLYIDTNNFLWIGTEYGLDLVNLNQVDFSLTKPKLHFQHYMPSSNINSISFERISCINEDSLGHIWIGTRGGGLNKFDTKTQKFTTYTVNDGLPNNIINGVLFDGDNNPWISTNNGLSFFNIKTNQFKNYDTSDGLQSNVFIKTACLKTSDGMFLFGGINGFNAFYPNNITSTKVELRTVLTNFILFNQTVKVGSEINNRIILPKAVSDLDTISLFHKENSFAFEFSALNFSNPDKIHYSYRLEGFDDEWQFTDSKIRIAKYTNLSPGKYIFKVKASNNKETWSDLPTTLSIIILPPWWKTLWFRIVVVILAISLWVIFFTIRVYRLEKQKHILKSKVEEKTKQLRESNVMKDKFLSIIAHDLLNPFNTILGFSEILLNNYSEWDEEAKIESITAINQSSNNLYELLGNLLQWSRSERGLLEYFPEKIDLNDCIEKSIELQKATAKTKNISIRLSEGNIYNNVYSDVQLLNAIFRNLISNAIKFTQEGGLIYIKTERLNDFTKVSVIDNGIGIKKEFLANMFRIDIQHSTTGTNDEKGTGLGLFLVKEFVNKQQGTLAIESKVGKGSTFSFTIPIWKE